MRKPRWTFLQTKAMLMAGLQAPLKRLVLKQSEDFPDTNTK